MEQDILKALRTCDVEKFEELKEEIFPEQTTYCRILKDREDVYLQRVYDGDFPMEIFLQGENEFFDLCARLFKSNSKGQVCGYFVTVKSLIWRNYYAKKTWNLLQCIRLNRKKNRFMMIDSLDLLKSMVQVGCREIGFTVLYFPRQKICIGIDALKCIFLSEDKNTVLSCLKSIRSEHEIY